MSEREQRIANLQAAVAERDALMATLKQKLEELNIDNAVSPFVLYCSRVFPNFYEGARQADRGDGQGDYFSGWRGNFCSLRAFSLRFISLLGIHLRDARENGAS